MLYLKEHKRKPTRVSDFLPWAHMVAEGVILNKDGSFQRTFYYRGPDVDSSTEEELMSISARINNTLKRLGSGFCLWFEASRKESTFYPQSNFESRLASLIDEERKFHFQDSRHFETSYYFTIQWLPPSDNEEAVHLFFKDEDSDTQKSAKDTLKAFVEETEKVAYLLQGVLPQIRALNSDETLTYLHGLISDKEQRVSLKAAPLFLDAMLSDTPVTGGAEPAIGTTKVSVVSIKGFPSASEPALFDSLNRLSVRYRWVNRFIPLSKTEAERELTKLKKKWFGKRKNLFTILQEECFSSPSIMTDNDAVRKSGEVDEALLSLSADEVSYGYYTGSILLFAEGKESLEQKTKEVESAINSPLS